MRIGSKKSSEFPKLVIGKCPWICGPEDVVSVLIGTNNSLKAEYVLGRVLFCRRNCGCFSMITVFHKDWIKEIGQTTTNST
jgi:hypothetical protein